MHIQTPISVTIKSLQYTFVITTGADGMTMLLAIVHAEYSRALAVLLYISKQRSRGKTLKSGIVSKHYLPCNNNTTKNITLIGIGH